MTDQQNNQRVTNQKWNNKWIHYTHHNDDCIHRVLKRVHENFDYDKKGKGFLIKGTKISVRNQDTVPYDWLVTKRRNGND